MSRQIQVTAPPTFQTVAAFLLVDSSIRFLRSPIDFSGVQSDFDSYLLVFEEQDKLRVPLLLCFLSSSLGIHIFKKLSK